MLKKITFLLLIVSFSLSVQAQSQTDPASEKRVAVKELVALMNSGNQAEQIFKVFSAQADNIREATIRSLIDERTDLSESEKKSLFESLTANQRENSKRITEKLLQKLNFNEMITEIGIAVYEKHYTADEIKEILAFYKTPTGQKLLKTMNPVMNDTMMMVQERLIPKIPVILKELEEEQKEEIKREIETKKPRTAKGTI